MEEEQTAPVNQPAPDEPSEKSIEWQKVALGAGILVLILALGIISFFIGRSSGEAETPSPTPVPLFIPSPTLPTATPTATASATITPSTSPTPSPTPTPQIKTKTLSSAASLDGFRASNGGGNDGIEIRAGRNVSLAMRGFVSFDLSGIPEGSTITEATLRLYQYDTVGDPYGVGGALKIDHLNYGDSLENEDYASAALLSSFTTLTTNAAVEWKDVEVTTQVKDDLDNSRLRSQFRIHFTTETTGGDATGDFAYFESADDSQGTGNTPELVIKYY